MSTPEVYVLFMEDVRHEVGNKRSFMGVLGPDLITNNDEGLLPKIVIYVSIAWKANNPPNGWSVHIELPNGKKPAPFLLPPEGSEALKPDLDSGMININFIAEVHTVPLKPDTRISVFLEKDRRKKIVGSLRFALAQASATDLTVANTPSTGG